MSHQSILDKYLVVFEKTQSGKPSINCKNVVSAYLYLWRDMDEIDELLSDVDLCLNNRYDEVLEPHYGDGLLKLYGYLEPTTLTITGGLPSPFVIPLQDFKKLLLAWRIYLLKG